MDWSYVQPCIGDLLTVGAVGFVAGVLAPLAFRLIGYIIDSVRLITKGENNG